MTAGRPLARAGARGQTRIWPKVGGAMDRGEPGAERAPEGSTRARTARRPRWGA